MSTLQGKTVVVIGGSSGIGYSVAKNSLISLADHVTIASSSQAKIHAAVTRLLAEPELQKLDSGMNNRIAGDVVDLENTESIHAFFDRVGEIDHLVITGGGAPPSPSNIHATDLSKLRDAFDLRFWGSAAAAQAVKLRSGGSITFTIGAALFRPFPGWSIPVSVVGAVDALSRSLAVDLAPSRVNVVCPGIVNTEIRDHLPKEVNVKILKDAAEKLLVKHVAIADEVAESYLFLMKCNYITGQCIVVDGGGLLV